MSHFLKATAADTASWARLFWLLETGVECAPLHPPTPKAVATAHAVPAVGCSATWSRLIRGVSRRLQSRAAAPVGPQPVPQPAQSNARADTDAVRALLATAHEDLITIVYAQHPTIADAALPLRQKLARLPDSAGVAADAAALRSCLRSTPEGKRLTLDPCMHALCARVVAAVPRVPELRALALRLTGSINGSIAPALSAATQLLTAERALPRVTDVEVQSMLWPAQQLASELEQLAQLLALVPSVTRLRLPHLGVDQGHEALLAASLASLTALRRLYLGSECEQLRQVDYTWPNIALNLSALPRLTSLRSLDVSGSRDEPFIAPVRLADGVRSLPRLRRLRASCAGLDDAALVAILQAIHSTIRHLDVSRNQLRCETACADAICNAHSLQRLDLGGNSIRVADAAALVQRLPALTALQHLDLGAHTAADGAVFVRAAGPLASLTKLSFISIEGLGGAAAAAHAPAFAALPRLRDLGLTERCAGVVIGGATALRRLRMSGVGLVGAQGLALALPALPQLLHLHVDFGSSHCPEDVSATHLAVLLGGLAGTPLLQSFRLCSWLVRGTACERALAAVLPLLTCLAQLELPISPALSVDCCQVLPASVTHLALGRRLPIKGGRHFVDLLPEAIARATHLRSLQMSGLDMQGLWAPRGKLPVTHRWGEALAQLPHLHTCELRDPNMHPVWVQQLAPHLAKCRALTRLCLHAQKMFTFERALHPSHLVDAVVLGGHLCALTRLQFLQVHHVFDKRRKGQFASTLEAAMAGVPGLELQVL